MLIHINKYNIDSFLWKSCKTRDLLLILHLSISEFMWFNALERSWYLLCYQLLHWHFVICRCGFQLMHEKWSPSRFFFKYLAFWQGVCNVLTRPMSLVQYKVCFDYFTTRSGIHKPKKWSTFLPEPVILFGHVKS